MDIKNIKKKYQGKYKPEVNFLEILPMYNDYEAIFIKDMDTFMNVVVGGKRSNLDIGYYIDEVDYSNIIKEFITDVIKKEWAGDNPISKGKIDKDAFISYFNSRFETLEEVDSVLEKSALNKYSDIIEAINLYLDDKYSTVLVDIYNPNIRHRSEPDKKTMKKDLQQVILDLINIFEDLRWGDYIKDYTTVKNTIDLSNVSVDDIFG